MTEETNITAGLKWLGGRFAVRAKEARQAESVARRLNLSSYPHAGSLSRQTGTNAPHLRK